MVTKLLFLFPVSVLSNLFYPREKCPGDVTEWNKLRLNCSGPDYIYHCLLDDKRQLGEICIKGPAVRVQKGYCPEYNHNARTLTTVLCNATGCPSVPFYSNQVYEFPMCLTIGDGKEVRGKETPPVPSLRIITAVAAPLLVLLLVAVGTICIIRRRKRKEGRGSEDQEMQLLSKENETPFEFCRLMDYLEAGAFVETDLFTQALGKLQSEWCITIIGPSGSGKTMLAIELARENFGTTGRSQKKRTYHFCRSFDDIFGLPTDNEEPYAIMDDFMEQYRIYPSKMSQDMEKYDRIFNELIHPKLVHVIFTVQEGTWNDLKHGKKLFESKKLIKLAQKSLTEEDKEAMMQNHPNIRDNQIIFTQKKDEKLIPTDPACPIKVHKKSLLKIIVDLKEDPPFSIPLIIDLIFTNIYLLREYRSLLSSNLNENLRKQVKAWKESDELGDRKSICVVLLTAFCGGVLCLDKLDGHEAMYRGLCKMHRHTEPSDRTEIEDMIEKNDNVRGFLYRPAKKSNTYVFHHNLLLDLFLVYVSPDEDFFIENMDIDYLITRCKLSTGATTQSKNPDNFPVEEDAFQLTNIGKLVDRVILEGKDLTSDRHVFMKNPKFKQTLSRKLKSSRGAVGEINEKTENDNVDSKINARFEAKIDV